MATKSRKWLKRLCLTIATIVAVYLLAALFGSIFPANQDWQEPDDGIELFIETNGIHTGIIMPIRSDVHDWGEIVRPEHLADPSRYGSHILVGWGHEGVYRNAEKWTDLRIGDALSAVFGTGDTLVHVYHLQYPQPYPHYRRSLRVTENEYRSIVNQVQAKFVTKNGVVIPSRGYGETDLFYASVGTYTAFNTCNNWTNSVLKQAGIRTARWTPFQGGVMRWIAQRQTGSAKVKIDNNINSAEQGER